MGATTVRAAIYLRISLDALGDGLAVTRQREDCEAIARQRGWTIVGEYCEKPISASDSTRVRPEYDRLVADYQRGAFDALICYDLDRLTRQPRQLEDWLDAAEKQGLRVVTANGEADLSTDGGQLFARVKIAVARSEVQRKAARQRRAALQRAEMGKPPKGVRLTGYTTDGTTVEDEARVIRKIFDRFAAGDSLRSLAAWLTENDVPTRTGHPWNPSSVRTILTNPRYAGRAVYQGKANGKAGNWESFVDSATFDVIQARLADPRRRTQVGTDRKHLGAGLFRCGSCGAKLHSWSAARYRCPEGCVTRSQGHIDALVLQVVRGRLSRPDLAELIPAPDDETVRGLNSEITNLRLRIEQIEADYDVGHIDGRRFALATEKVTAELRQAEAALARTAPTQGIALLRGPDPLGAFEAAPLMIRRSVIETLMTVRIHSAPRGRKTFDPESVKIEWNT